MKKFLLVLALGLIAFTATACGNGDDDDDDDSDDTDSATPEITGVTDETIAINSEIDLLEGVSASDEEDGDLTADIVVDGTVDNQEEGDYVITYTVTDSDGNETEETRTITVSLDVPTLANGVYNYKYAGDDLRNTLFAAAESYLLDTMAGGVPLFSNSGYVMYSNRLTPAVDEYVPVMGYGPSLGTMSEDDSTVEMFDESDGEEGEYTYRTTIGGNPSTFFHWQYEDADSSDSITWVLDALYYFDYTDDGEWFEMKPSMATDVPQPIDSELNPDDVEVSTKWQVSLRDDLEWSYHPDTDTSGFPDGHEVIDAHDFIDTYKLALEEGWFRAISGGGDFLSAPQKIVGAQAFYDAQDDDDETPDWDSVGLKVVDDHTIEFEFVNNIAEDGVMYWLSSFVMTPINLDLYDMVGDQYGTSDDTTAYNGPFVLDYWEDDKLLEYKENPNFHDPNRYFITGVQVGVFEDIEIIWQEWEDDRLDGVGVPAAEYPDVANEPNIYFQPGATTFRMMINGLGTTEAQRDQFPDSDYEPEPLLAHEYFKKAMYFGVDRAYLAEDVMVTSTPQMYHFTEQYLLSPSGNIPFRETEQGASVGDGLSPSTNGFNEDAAKAYFKAAIDDLVADGVYEEGDVIDFDLFYFAGSETQANFGEYVKQQFEEIFVYDDLLISVTVNTEAVDFPDIYFSYMMIGEFDLSIGGISGSALDAASFLDVYADDNRGGFTLNFGIDTSSANIEVEYLNPYIGETITEIWSYNALVEALNGEVEVVDGVEYVEETEE